MISLLPFKKTLLFIFLLAGYFVTVAAEPTVSASNVVFNSQYVDGGQFQFTFTAGNGAGRLIVVKEGAEISGRPADGTAYTANTTATDARFGVAGTEIAPGEWAVYAGSGTTITVTGVKPATTYYVAIFEYNGTYATPATIDYSPLTPSGQKVTTRAAPTIASTITNFSLVNGNSLRVHYTMGNGTGRIVAARKGTTLAATPVDLVSYTGGSGFMSTTNSSYYLDAETFVVQKNNKSGLGSADYANVMGLEPNTTYTFAVFEYNGSIWATTPVYLRPGSVQTITTTAGPTLAASSVGFSAVDGDRMTVSCRVGDGKRRLIIARKGAPVTAVPVNGMHYTAAAQLGSGTEMGAGSGEYVVYDGVSNSVIVTGLETFTTYHFAVYEYDQDNSGYTYYLTTTPGQGSHATVLPPTANTVLSVAALTGSSVQLKYNYPSSGYGAYRLLVIKDGVAVDFEPQDLKVYSGSSTTFGAGQQVAPGTFLVIGQSNGGAPTVTGLTPGHTYYATVFDMNGQFAPMYLRPGSSVVINVPNEPTTAASAGRFTSVEGNALSFDWTNGDGSRRLVVARKGTAVTSIPPDGTTYTAAARFGSGSELTAGSGEYVVYDGTASSVNVAGLEKGTTYHFAVFEYNSGTTGPDYLTTAGKWLAAAGTTLSTPTVQVSNLAATNIKAAQATITFTVGDGSSRLFLLREGTPVDAEPAEYTTYATNNNYAAPITQVGSGNYAVASGNASFTVLNLKAATRYYLTAFEYNGSSGPVYLRPGAAAYSFVTAAAGVAAPTGAASAPLFENIDGNKFTFKWTAGNGAGRIVIARKGAPVTFTPLNGTDYTANAVMGSGADLGSGQFVVYNGAANTVALTALEPSATYHFAVYEYNGTGSSTVYGATALVASQATAMPPPTASTALAMVPASNTLQLSWTAGSGTGRLVVMREGSPVSGTSAVLTAYSASTSFQNGAQLAAGEYAVYAGSGTSVTVQGLSSGKTYYVSLFEYNGLQAPVYNTEAVLTGSMALAPLPVRWVSFTAAPTTAGVVLRWTTAQEAGAAYFEVQESPDGHRYTALGRVAAAGDSEAARSYSFTAPAAGGQHFYRLKQVDRDGGYAYSKVLQVKGDERPVALRQNPVGNYLRLQGNACPGGGTLVITDAAGRVVHRAGMTSVEAPVAVSHLSPGFYYVSLYDTRGAKVATLPFIR